MTVTQINNLIADRMVTKLTADMIANQTDTDLKAGLVRKGTLQDNPEKYRIVVLVHPGGDPDDNNWKSVSVAYQEQQPERRQLSPPAFEVGGGTMWYRRGVVEWQFFGTKTKEDRDEAMNIGHALQALVERAIANADYDNLKDDFGEVGVMGAKAYWSYIEPGGGPRASFIYRGKTGWQALTERSY